MFDSGSSIGRLRDCPLLGAWRALLCGEVLIGRRMVPDLEHLFGRRMTSEYHFPERGTSGSYVLRSFAVFQKPG